MEGAVYVQGCVVALLVNVTYTRISRRVVDVVALHLVQQAAIPRRVQRVHSLQPFAQSDVGGPDPF